jgi:hypothetical protein
MPTPDCPEAREYVGPTWPATLAPPFDLPAHYPTPAAFAPRVAWACVAVHYDYPDTMVKDAEEAADPDTWRTRTAALGAYEYPAEVFAQQPGVEFGVGGVTGARGNPWTFLAAMRVMGDDTLGGTITDVYRLTGTTSLPGFPAGAFILQQGDATAVDGTSPAQYAAVFGPPESQGRHFDAATGTWTAIPGGTGGDLGTHLLRFGNEHPFEASSWTGYLAYNVPPLGVPGDPLCGPEVEPLEWLPWDGGDAWGKPYGIWRGGSVGAVESVISGIVPSGAVGGGWRLAAGAYVDPMARLWARVNGGTWVAGTVADTPGFLEAGRRTATWPHLAYAVGDLVELGASNVGDYDGFSPADFTDPRMGRASVRPLWMRCKTGRRAPRFHLG